MHFHLFLLWYSYISKSVENLHCLCVPELKKKKVGGSSSVNASLKALFPLCFYILFKITTEVPWPVWLTWLDSHLAQQNAGGSIPDQAISLGCRSDFWSGCIWEVTNWCFPLSLLPPLSKTNLSLYIYFNDHRSICRMLFLLFIDVDLIVALL